MRAIAARHRSIREASVKRESMILEASEMPDRVEEMRMLKKIAPSISREIKDAPGAFVITRRGFLISSAVAGGGLLLNCLFQPAISSAAATNAESQSIPLNAWLRIGKDDGVTIMVSQAEMGQGIITTLPAVLADELGADWERVQFENAPADPAYRNPRL